MRVTGPDGTVRFVRQEPGSADRRFKDVCTGEEIPEATLEPAMRAISERGRCPTCHSAALILRDGKHRRVGRFYGCERYIPGQPPVAGVNCVTKIFLPHLPPSNNTTSAHAS